jgi:hypothetical protein
MDIITYTYTILYEVRWCAIVIFQELITVQVIRYEVAYIYSTVLLSALMVGKMYCRT